MRIVALQSGTSADGIDAVVADVDLTGDGMLDIAVQGGGTHPWTVAERREVLRAIEGESFDPGAWCALTTTIGQAMGRAAVASIAAHGPCDLVVSHGQTVFHGVDADTDRVWGTLQLGEPAWIARATGLPVVFNLRVADVAAGGMGAPLMAAFDRLWLAPLAATAGAPVASLNLGGIANVQVVTADGGVDAFDTGPANALLDAWITRATGGAETYDRDGRRSAAGRVDQTLLARLCEHPYLSRRAPKTTGRETFALAFVDEALSGEPGASRPSLDDMCATLAEFTAQTVGAALRDAGAVRVIASGGGARNPDLLARISRASGIDVESSDAHGIPGDLREALMFAVLGFFAAARVRLHLPATPDAGAAVAGQWDLSLAPLPAAPAAEAVRGIRLLTGRTNP